MRNTDKYSCEAEQKVCAAAMRLPNIMDRLLTTVPTAAFYFDEYRRIYEAATGLYLDGQPIDPITIMDRVTANGSPEDVNGMDHLIDLHGLEVTEDEAVALAAKIDIMDLRRMRAKKEEDDET